VDVDGNGEIDLIVYLAGVSEDGVAEVTLKTPSQEIISEEPSLAWVWWIVVLAVIVVAIAYFVMHRRKASKRRGFH
jgi:type II secretory pathway component PulF